MPELLNLNDIALKISTGVSRYATTWQRKTLTWQQLYDKLSTTVYTTETVAQYHAMPKAKQLEIKDVGGMVCGWLKNNQRKKQNLTHLSLIALDLDYLDHDPRPEIQVALAGYNHLYHSTHSHTPSAPRLRLLIPAAREITAEEYEPIARWIANRVGIDYFDPTTYQGERMMFNPSTPADGEYVFGGETQGALLEPDDVLASYSNWRHIEQWPRATREHRDLTTAIRQGHSMLQDPATKTGVIGAFCKTYTIPAVIDAYLADVYRHEYGDRWTYIAGESIAGLVVYDNNTLAYSNHATDPANIGHCLNAFDLVRIHKHAHLDTATPADASITSHPSYHRMLDVASADPKVKAELVKQRLKQNLVDFQPVPKPATQPSQDPSQTTQHGLDALNNLDMSKQGHILNSQKNYELILDTIPALAGIRLNEQTMCIEVDPEKSGQLPWRQPQKGTWSSYDQAALQSYIEKTAGIWSPTKLYNALEAIAAKRSYHPIKQYLEALPAWDSTPRVETLFIDYLGADDTPYVRAVAKLMLTAMIARIYQPGCKFDHMPVLVGQQGIGKSTLFAKLAGKWHTDALAIADMKDAKLSAEKLSLAWIAEAAELAGQRKTEVEAVKAFITRRVDRYRPAYARQAQDFPRQSILVGTTNAVEGFLRDITGNRRFLPVLVHGHSRKTPFDITEKIRQQILAEAKHHYANGAKLYLEAKYDAEAQQQQTAFLEADERVGLVQEYLEQLLPATWEDKDLDQRRFYLETAKNTVTKETLRARQTVSNIEVWAECFGNDPAKMTTRDSYMISGILQQIPGWKRAGARKHLPIYGRQRLWEREVEMDLSWLD